MNSISTAYALRTTVCQQLAVVNGNLRVDILRAQRQIFNCNLKIINTMKSYRIFAFPFHARISTLHSITISCFMCMKFLPKYFLFFLLEGVMSMCYVLHMLERFVADL